MVNDNDDMQVLVDQVRSTYDVKMDENSPFSSSMYFLTNDTLIRVANHWGRCASCTWTLDSDKQFQIGVIRFDELCIVDDDEVNIVTYLRCRDFNEIPDCVKSIVPQYFDATTGELNAAIFGTRMSSFPEVKAAIDAARV